MQALSAALLLAAVTPGQVQWRQLGLSPALGSGWGAAYDSDRDRVVLFGHWETWEFDGTVWTRLQPTRIPPLLGTVLSMAYDPVRRRTVLFMYPQTWEWDGAEWTQANAAGPPILGAPLVFHAGRGRLMAFGGGDSNGPRNDLWEWDGSVWRLVPATNQPPVFASPATSIGYSTLAYSQDRDVLSVFGASTLSGTISGALAVTWEWDAAGGWRQVNAGGPVLHYRQMVYDLQRRTLVVVGGSGGAPGLQFWERLGTSSWQSRILAGPSGGVPLLLVFDSRRGRSVLLTNGRTMVYEPRVPATFVPHGTGCPGSLGVPTMRTEQPWSLPWLGDTSAVTVEGLPLSAAVLATGFDDRWFRGLRLPLDLWFYAGLRPGCQLYLAPVATSLITGSGNRASHSLPIPNAPSLLGSVFYQQALVFDPLALGGATMSYSAAATIGER